MRKLLKRSYLFLLLFFIILFKESIYSLFIKSDNNINKNIITIKNNYYYDEYQKLTKFLDIKNDNNFNYTYSKVLYRNIYSFYDEITILKGNKHNLMKNMPVVCDKGLIGTISKVNNNSSVVNLITNKNSNISVRINDSYGILKKENNDLVVKSINNYENINIGDLVYTSGLGNIPAMILIGEVVKIDNKDLIEQIIVVEPICNINDLNYVAIIMDGNV